MIYGKAWFHKIKGSVNSKEMMQDFMFCFMIRRSADWEMNRKLIIDLNFGGINFTFQCRFLKQT